MFPSSNDNYIEAELPTFASCNQGDLVQQSDIPNEIQHIRKQVSTTSETLKI